MAERAPDGWDAPDPLCLLRRRFVQGTVRLTTTALDAGERALPFSLQASAGCEEVVAHPLEATLLASGNRRHGLPTEHAEHGRPLAFGADFFPSTYGRLPGERLQHGDHQTNPARPALLFDVRPYLPEDLARASARMHR